MQASTYHSFHIPVMGLAYTIDTPIKVARFGISSVISIMEDRLIELMRSYYYPTMGMSYTPISTHEEDYRARRITDYLNLVQTIVFKQIEKLKASSFEPGSEIVKYFELLPDNSPLKQVYLRMTKTRNLSVRAEMEHSLRSLIRPGAIDVNIMTKTDRPAFSKTGEIIENGSDAVSALRGFAKSNLIDSSVIFSAGMNPRLFSYLEQCPAFHQQEDGSLNKKVTIKVSDYRSALIQGKYLAKKGIWVSEFRIESGLNCGGHAFATDGVLLGPILEEFRSKRETLRETLFDLYQASLSKENRCASTSPLPIRLSVQGGIGTSREEKFLRQHYEVDSTGWGTPFLLVPEATTVDPTTLSLLASAKSQDIVLSHHSPLGVRFHYLKGTTADHERLDRITAGNPGSPCTEKHLALNTEFTEIPICTASRKYQQLKIKQLQSLQLPAPDYKKQVDEVLDKECLCVGLSNAAPMAYHIPFLKKLNAVTICPGPNIAYFDRVVSLGTMVDHIYGRTNILSNPSRPNMFIAELKLYIQYFAEMLSSGNGEKTDPRQHKYFSDFYANLQEGIAYYRGLSKNMVDQSIEFVAQLNEAEHALKTLYEHQLIK